MFRHLGLRRRHAREYAAANPGGFRLVSGPLRGGDFEAYLQRRLARSTARIESHLVAHGCQE